VTMMTVGEPRTVGVSFRRWWDSQRILGLGDSWRGWGCADGELCLLVYLYV
jgi:hypothetical protein